jgi:hypothetical protein
MRILKNYLNKLTNLSGNNRSILLLRLTEQFFDLNDLDFQFKEPSFSFVEDLIARKSNIKLLEALNSREGESNRLSVKLKKLYRQDHFIQEERGAKDLYVGWPFVKGKLLDETAIRAPLLFFPVELEFQNNVWRLSLRKDESVILNKSFLLAFAHFNKIPVSDELIETQFDEWSKNSQVFRTELYRLLKESGLEINFNQELFIDKLIPFHNYRKDEFELKYKVGELKLFSEAVLGIFPQAGSYLVPDYNYLLENKEFNDLEELFLKRTSIENGERDSVERFNYLNKVKEENTFTPFPIDASQENSLKAVKTGKSIVVQGPPGSGKSQMICNLISDHIARGKKVLMVCQKRVALDVVYERLQSQGFSDFVALVHDFRNDKKNIYSQIQSQIARLEEYQEQNKKLDTVYLERTFLQISRRIDQLSEEMEEFKKALFDHRECGLSIKELYLTSEKNAPIVDLSDTYKHFNFDSIGSFLSTLKYYLSYSETFEKKAYQWKKRKSFASHTIADLNSIKSTIGDITEYAREVSEKTTLISGKPLEFKLLEVIAFSVKDFKDFLKSAEEEGVFNYFKLIDKVSSENSSWLKRFEKRFYQSFEGDGPELTIGKSKLGDFQEALIKAEDAADSVISWWRWNMFAKDRATIKKTLLANGLKVNKTGIETLTKKLDNRLNLEHNLTELSSKKWLQNLPEQHQKILYQNLFYKYEQAFKLKERYRSIKSIVDLDAPNSDIETLKYKVNELLSLSNQAIENKRQWLKFLSNDQINDIIEKPSSVKELIEVLENDFDALCEYDKTFLSFTPPEAEVVKKLVSTLFDRSGEAQAAVFLNSLKIKWIDHIEEKYPILRSVSTQKFRQMELELQEKVKEKGKLSRDILLLKLREKTYQNLEINRLNNVVTYRDLSHQVSKKRMIWPIRKLITSFSEEIFSLVPCWMASPESVSSIFPMQQYFDLVIFDEASQCFAENGIPSVYRAHQVVITGDSKQLNPNDIYKIRWETNDEDLPETEIDSLLDLGARFLMQTQLSGHYRSRTLELIDFSNHHFYKGKLSLMPHYSDLNKKEPSIEYIKVDGIWDKNSNDTEAKRVVSLVIELIQRGEPEIGVVTFNYTQQSLIQNELEEEAAKFKLNIPSSLFIKNIENVQGDERDIIIFSIGYAPDYKGKMSMNFGSLNAQGGENRLNVAITRARKKVIIVTSIYPDQLKVEDSRQEGPKLFKKYLEFAREVSNGTYRRKSQVKSIIPFEGILKNKIISLLPDVPGKVLKNELPFSDLAILLDGQVKGLILTDDELYHESISTKDFHVYKKLTLQSKGWRFKDYYSREYWNNKEGLKEDYLKFKERLD